MSLISIKQYIQDNLPSNNAIAITILIGVLKGMADEFYGAFPEGEEFTTTLLGKLNGIATGAQVNPTSHEIAFINGLQAALDGKTTTTYVDSAIANLVDSSPATLDTLAELATALNNDPDFYNSFVSLINTKANKYTHYGDLDVNKGSTGVDDLAIEAGDVCRGWLSPTIFLMFGIYVSGLTTLVASYDPLSVDFIDTTI